MNIISKYSDFYDSALAYGVDTSIVYKRSLEQFILGKYPMNINIFDWDKWKSSEYEDIYRSLPTSLSTLLRVLNKETNTTFRFDRDTMAIYFRYVLFCGELIPIVEIEYNAMVDGYWNYKKVSDWFYDYDSMIDKVKKVLDVKDYTAFESFLNSKDSAYFSKASSSIRQKIKNFLGYKFPSTYESIHHDMDCPIILLTPNTYTKNPILKDIDFARKYDPFTAYQKLEMFISGVLGGCSPSTVKIADIHRLEAHGFDKKTSFRKGKEV